MNNPAHFTLVDGEQLDTETAYRLLVGCVVPRPIAWISSVSAAGVVNVAPFSSYNYVATSPPMLQVMVCIWATQTSQLSSIAISTISCILASPT